VGFQTKMKYGAQGDVFRMIPGLQDAKFARLGGIHRNTFLNSPTLLDGQMRLKSRPNIRFAGQITGGAEAKTFQPMNVNFGLFPPVDGLKGGRRGRKDRYRAYTDRAKADWRAWLAATALDAA
jgi:methylenetetrahydrofolate--tRNA-(uracil-5-)-methyltransferase